MTTYNLRIDIENLFSSLFIFVIKKALKILKNPLTPLTMKYFLLAYFLIQSFVMTKFECVIAR